MCVIIVHMDIVIFDINQSAVYGLTNSGYLKAIDPLVVEYYR